VKRACRQQFHAGNRKPDCREDGSGEQHLATAQAGNGLRECGEPPVPIPLPSAGIVLRLVAGQRGIIPRGWFPEGDAPRVAVRLDGLTSGYTENRWLPCSGV
jgi:hypothetical protein